MKFLVIGLGIYGSNLCRDLTAMGHEVIGVDPSPSIVESIKDSISAAYIMDSTDETSLQMLPLRSVDLVIVAIGENFGAGVRTVALLKKAGVEHIFARASDPLHEAILEGFHIDRILTPEQQAASNLVLELGLGSRVLSMPVDDDTNVVKFQAPAALEGMRYADLKLDDNFGVRLIAAVRSRPARNMVGMITTKAAMLPLADDRTLTVDPSADTLVCLASRSAWKRLLQAYS